MQQSTIEYWNHQKHSNSNRQSSIMPTKEKKETNRYSLRVHLNLRLLLPIYQYLHHLILLEMQIWIHLNSFNVLFYCVVQKVRIKQSTRKQQVWKCHRRRPQNFFLQKFSNSQERSTFYIKLEVQQVLCTNVVLYSLYMKVKFNSNFLYSTSSRY